MILGTILQHISITFVVCCCCDTNCNIVNTFNSNLLSSLYHYKMHTPFFFLYIYFYKNKLISNCFKNYYLLCHKLYIFLYKLNINILTIQYTRYICNDGNTNGVI